LNEIAVTGAPRNQLKQIPIHRIESKTSKGIAHSDSALCFWGIFEFVLCHCAPSARALPPILGFEEDNAGEGKSRKGNVSPRWDGLILVIRSNGLFCYLFHYSTPSIFKTRAAPAKVRFISWPGKFTTKTHCFSTKKATIVLFWKQAAPKLSCF